MLNLFLKFTSISLIINRPKFSSGHSKDSNFSPEIDQIFNTQKGKRPIKAKNTQEKGNRL